MASEFLLGLGKHSLFPEEETSIDFRDDIKGSLGKVGHRGTEALADCSSPYVAPGTGAAVTDSGHPQQYLGHRGMNYVSAPGTVMRATSTEGR